MPRFAICSRLQISPLEGRGAHMKGQSSTKRSAVVLIAFGLLACEDRRKIPVDPPVGPISGIIIKTDPEPDPIRVPYAMAPDGSGS